VFDFWQSAHLVFVKKFLSPEKPKFRPLDDIARAVVRANT
jgi:hypothetical protein